ncbi:MAG: SIS domain-containing protein, partial [bacterium]|nr:SIS domain-containing protein [bacterium]
CIQGGHAVFITGSGISGAIAKMLAFRLKQLGVEVEAYHIPEGVARSYRPGDVLFAISSSGTTKMTLTQVEQARGVEGVTIISIVSEPLSKIAQLSDIIIVLPRKPIKNADFFLLNTFFEIAATIIVNELILPIKQKLGVTEEQMGKEHQFY